LEGLATEDVGIFYGHFFSFMAIWWVYFPPFGNVAPRKIVGHADQSAVSLIGLLSGEAPSAGGGTLAAAAASEVSEGDLGKLVMVTYSFWRLAFGFLL
jgi:hypothetical protein